MTESSDDWRLQPLSLLAAAAAAAAESLQSCPTLCDPIDGSPPDSPGKNTGVGCHFLLQYMKVKSESEVTQLCPTLNDPMDCSLPGSSIHGIFQARVLEWGAMLSPAEKRAVKCISHVFPEKGLTTQSSDKQPVVKVSAAQVKVKSLSRV